ncbi:MAG: type II toxin-antitoxin system VapC family toxin [Caldilineaceae bacterium SB0666_bin_21]|nr:type II toxin-antitoxin system VapC family toxin [Caldilineaceae bacterium SB0666_bin_21]
MGMSEFAVVDASVAFKWLVEEEYSDEATSLTRLWIDEGIQPTAPSLMPFEVANALHRRVVRGDLSVEVAADLMQNLMSLGIALHETPHLHRRALVLAGQLGQGAVYDAHYLALAESLGCEFWTADRRFYRTARPSIDSVRWIGEFSAPE